MKETYVKNVNKQKTEINSLLIYLQDTYFIHCVKPNLERDCHMFDDNYVNKQLNSFGVVPLLNLYRNGFSDQLPYEMITSKFQEHIPKAALYSQYFCQDVLCAMGCDRKCYVLGQTQIFFRPKTSFAKKLKTMNSNEVKVIAKKINEKYIIRRSL